MPYPGRPGASPVLAALVAADIVRPDDRVLDLGCGRGADALALAAWGVRDVVGVDRDARAIAVARRRATRTRARVRFERADATALPFEDASFDAALDTLLSNNLTHEEIGRYAREVARVVRPDGLLVLSERVTRRLHRDPQRARPPDPFPRWFAFGTTTSTLLPEHPERGEDAPWARVAVSLGVRNRRRATSSRARSVPR